MLAKGIAAFSLLVCLSAHAETSKVEEGTDGGQWRVYGGDKAGTKYSPLEQINPENFSDPSPGDFKVRKVLWIDLFER